MTREADSYTPRGDTAAILDRALDLVQSVPYQVSARWLFYRLLQEGFYTQKGDYANKFLKAVSSARHSFYGGWRPDTLADETRESIVRGNGFDDPQEWLEALADRLTCNLDKRLNQDYYIEIWFEARAMIQQFQHYSQHVTLRPMGGQPSIPFKWQTAKDLEAAASRYGNPITILYFGDLDPAGLTIADTVRADVAKWCSVSFEFIRAGLNDGDPERYGIPENPEHPGAYQWEALSDESARQIITQAVAPYLRHDAIQVVEAKEQAATDWLRAKLAGLEYTGGEM